MIFESSLDVHTRYLAVVDAKPWNCLEELSCLALNALPESEDAWAQAPSGGQSDGFRMRSLFLGFKT